MNYFLYLRYKCTLHKQHHIQRKSTHIAKILECQTMLFEPVRSMTGYNRLTGHFLLKTRPQDCGRLCNRRQLWEKQLTRTCSSIESEYGPKISSRRSSSTSIDFDSDPPKMMKVRMTKFAFETNIAKQKSATQLSAWNENETGFALYIWAESEPWTRRVTFY